MLIYSRLLKLAPRLACFTRLALALPLAAGIAVSAAQSASGDVAVTPAAGGSFVVKDASGNTIRFRVTELGNVVISGLPSAATQTQPMCVNTSNGQVGPCAAGIGMGSVGPVGPKGDKGDAGAAGAVGAVGPKGDKGDKGDTGSAGAAGAVGAKGDKGDKGDAGAAGAAGAVGAKGDKGDTGAVGAAGAVGPAGVAGVPGAAGAVGSAGATGPVGPVGPVGAIGPKGDKGDKGDTGAPSVSLVAVTDLLYGDGSSGACNNCESARAPSADALYSSMSLNHNFLDYLPGSTWRVNGPVTLNGAQIKILPNEVTGGSTPAAGTGASPASRSSGGHPITLNKTLAALIAARDPLPTGGPGAAEAASIPSSFATGGSGGGGLRVFARGAITITKSVFKANGGNGEDAQFEQAAGSGGGSGGVIVLVSETSITITDSLFELSGGKGSDAYYLISTGGAGGGGGGAGGCVILIAPIISVPAFGWLVAPGGGFGANAIPAGSSDTRQGFGGGGNACQWGGNGAQLYMAAGIPFADPNRKATVGFPGRALEVRTSRPALALFAF